MKTYPNKERYHEILNQMSPQQILEKVFELTELSRTALKAGLKDQYPYLSESELNELYLQRLYSCHNQNY